MDEDSKKAKSILDSPTPDVSKFHGAVTSTPAIPKIKDEEESEEESGPEDEEVEGEGEGKSGQYSIQSDLY